MNYFSTKNKQYADLLNVGFVFDKDKTEQVVSSLFQIAFNMFESDLKEKGLSFSDLFKVGGKDKEAKDIYLKYYVENKKFLAEELSIDFLKDNFHSLKDKMTSILTKNKEYSKEKLKKAFYTGVFFKFVKKVNRGYGTGETDAYLINCYFYFDKKNITNEGNCYLADTVYTKELLSIYNNENELITDDIKNEVIQDFYSFYENLFKEFEEKNYNYYYKYKKNRRDCQRYICLEETLVIKPFNEVYEKIMSYDALQ